MRLERRMDIASQGMPWRGASRIRLLALPILQPLFATLAV